MKVDVAIIGAGPAGGMAACRLAETGLNILVLEKECLPRHKPCGGGLPAAVTSIIDWDFSALVESRVSSIRNLYNYEQPSLINDIDPILMVDRSRFDQHIIERAIKLGEGRVKLQEGATVMGVEERSDGVFIQYNLEGSSNISTSVEARYLIAADGVSSKAARCLGLKRKGPLAVAIDVEIEVDAEVYEAEKQFATFNFCCLPNGYGWTFPKRGVLSCGVGSWRGRPQLQRAMDEYLERSFPRGSIRSIRRYGHPLPLYSGHQTIATHRVCLVGDAASLVDPVMGEGIRFALRSGELAAKVISILLGANESTGEISQSEGCLGYQARVQSEISHDFELLHKFISPIFFAKPELFYRRFFQDGQSYHALARQLASRAGL